MAIPANAQKDEWNELFKSNLQLKKDIESLAADTSALHQAIEKFEAEQLLLDTQIDSIAKLCDELRGDVYNKELSAMQQKVNSLKADAQRLQSRKLELVSLNRQQEATLSQLKNNISSMGAYSEIKDQQMYSSYQEALTYPYSIITLEKISEIESKMNSFSTLPEYSEFKVRFASCKKNKELYDVAENLLNTKYDAIKIDKTRDRLYELLSITNNDLKKGIIKLSDAQYAEIDTLDIKLSRYGDGITVLQSIVKAVNESNVRESNPGDRDACIDAMRSIVVSETEENAEKRKRYFDMIPFLRDLYQKYWNELQADPFAVPTESENIIMQLKND